MNYIAQINRQKKGVTLIELTIIIAVILILVSISTISVGAYRDWQNGLAGTEALKSIYQAQRLFLADNPTTAVGSVTTQNILDNLPNNVNAVATTTEGIISLPDVTNPDGGDGITVNAQVSPPTLSSHSDPKSGDGLWEIN